MTEKIILLIAPLLHGDLIRSVKNLIELQQICKEFKIRNLHENTGYS